MIQRLHLVPVIALVGAALWGGVQALGRADGAADGRARDDVLMEAPFVERAQRDTQIVVWQSALKTDPTGAIILGQLAGLHLQRAREGGGWEDILIAESLARRSLAERVNRNGATAATLVATLVAQHRFTEAQAVAAALVEREPDV